MAEYYRNPYKSQEPRKQKRSLWQIVFDAAMSLVSFASVIALLIIFIGRFVTPERMWYFSLLGLAAPIIYVSVILSMLYWIVRWKWAAATLTGIFVLLGLFHVPLYYKLDFTKQYGEPKYDRNCIKVLTFNARYMFDDEKQQTVDSVARLVMALNPDIVCFQEYAFHAGIRQQMNEKLRGYTAVSSVANDLPVWSECFTKYRIIGVHRIEDMGGTGSCISTDMVINEDTVRVYNAHLQTTSVTSDDKAYISEGQFISDSTRDTRFIHIARGLRKNNGLRAHQAEIINRDIAGCSHPVILCGDFNDVPVSYTCRKASRGLDDTFSKQGHLYAHTFRGFFNTLRIDYIFVSPQFETVSYEVIPTGSISDHYPVMVRLKQPQKL